MKTKSVLMTFLVMMSPASLFADVLVSGSVYFDSQQTFDEVKKLAAQGDNTEISRLISDGHVSKPVLNELEVSVLSPGQHSGSPVEFRFKDKPTTYWTVAKFIKAGSPSVSVTDPALSQAPSPTPAPTSGPALQPSRSHHAHHRYHHLHRYWHSVNGHLRWSPVPLKSP